MLVAERVEQKRAKGYLMRVFLVVVCLLISSVSAETPTPLEQVLPAGDVSLIACSSPYSAPQGVPGWPKDNLFHYRLYLPADYHANAPRKYPLMFVAAPAGDARMGEMAARLKRDRWIVVMLVESRNRSIVWYPNFVAAHDDVLKRVRAHHSMLFCTGFSGGARVCGTYPSIRPGFQGLILQAAGFPKRPAYLIGANAHIAVHGTFGTMDMNLREARRLRAGVPPHTRRLIEVWDGGHRWAPAPVFDRTLDWIEDKVFLEAEYDEGLADAYWWYFTNALARYDRAQSASERYMLHQLLQSLPEQWHLTLDAAASEKLRTIAAAVQPLADDAALRHEFQAREAFRQVLALEEQSRGVDLEDLAAQYRQISERYPQTVYGQRAAVRTRSVSWEAGVSLPGVE